MGSAWRGAFGRALRRSVCVTRAADCAGCLLLEGCPYPHLFDTPRVGAAALNPYVLVPDRAAGPCELAPGDALHLGLVLIGRRAVDRLPYVVHALERAGAQGLTARRVPLALRSIEGWDPRQSAWAELYRPGRPLVQPTPAELATPPVPAHCRVRLVTPLRVKHRGRLLRPEALDFQQFFRAIGRRILNLAQAHGGAVRAESYAEHVRGAAAVPIQAVRLQWHDWTRYSARQRTRMQLGGIAGEFQLRGSQLLAPFWPWLWLGQWVHAGRATTMGLGMYRIEADGLPPLPW